MTPRRATAADAPRISAVVRAAYEKYLARMDRPPAPLLDAPDHGEVWVVGDPVVGVLHLEPGPSSLTVVNVAVDPSAQGTGLGRALLAFAEDEARRLGLRRLALYTNEVMTENLALYGHLGFRETGRRTEDGYARVFLEKNVAEA